MSQPKVFVRDCCRLLVFPLGMTVALAAAIVLLPTQAAAQALYGSVTGTIADGTGAAVPGASVTIKNENTGLELTAVTDETGTYTIRNITGGTYTLRASLQGFKEFVQTGIPITAGGIVRINGRLEIGALTESVTVTTEATVLKTDKADVSVDLRPEDVVNLPLNQYRNYQYLMNLVPGATPPAFQNAQTDTPGRALTTNINGTNRNNNVTRIDGAASINVWLPHHAGYIAPVETIENVNISTNSFDAAQGMTGGAATAVVTKSGTNTLKGSAFYFRQQDEFNARRGYFDPSKVDASTRSWAGPSAVPSAATGSSTSDRGSATPSARASSTTYTVPTARMRNGDFGEVLAFNPTFRIYDPATGNVQRRGPHVFRERGDSRQPHQRHLEEDPGAVPGAEQPRHEQRPPEQPVHPAQPHGRPRQLRRQGQLEPHVGTPDLGQVLDDGGLGVRPVLPRSRRRRRRATRDIRSTRSGRPGR